MLRRLFGKKNPKVFFKVSADGVNLGEIVFELRADLAPKTVENFRQLCIGSKSTAPTGQALWFKGSIFHKIIPRFMCQGGDFTHSDGTGGWSIYGAEFPDESFRLRHTTSGLLSMANSGPDTNNSQFLITTASCRWLDGKNTVFGCVVEGMDVVKKIESYGTITGEPKARVVIEDCGEKVKPKNK
ncbi:hypothetical protein SteCoe_2415 [Stentor coeruleus]|uniref:Peptidyl-prolyl cis-trans isomerase n=1 Tax=Stentor coeruleus TaxID=5963 RepID=A0A1R2CZE5_9CILI|nr:hypothetical protein SteCoe_2415 [Stentor coeruleus]